MRLRVGLVLLALVAAAAAAAVSREALRIAQHEGTPTSEYRVPQLKSTYGDYSLQFEVELESELKHLSPAVKIWLHSQDSPSGVDTPLPFGSAMLVTVTGLEPSISKQTSLWAAEVCIALKPILSNQFYDWMAVCVPSIESMAPISTKVFPALPALDATNAFETGEFKFGQIDAFLLQLHDWGRLGVSLAPVGFFYSVSRINGMPGSFKATNMSSLIIQRRKEWKVPELELDSPLKRFWTITPSGLSATVSYSEHGHFRTTQADWSISKPSEDFTSLAGDAPHENPSSAHGPILQCTKRNLEGAGFHRSLRTEITLAAAPETSDVDLSSCRFVVAEFLDRGIFVDRYEVAEMHRMNAGPKVDFFADIDLEKPAYESKQNLILIHAPLVAPSDGNTSWRLDLKLPVHLRYHAPSWETLYQNVAFPKPEVFMQCKGETKWVHLVHWGASGLNTCPRVEMPAPVGDYNMERMITWVTIGITALGSLVLLLYITDCCTSPLTPEQDKVKKTKYD